jgi:hypothetical protein
MAAYLGEDATFENALVEFSRAYADTNERDHERLCQAIEAGELVAEPGV